MSNAVVINNKFILVKLIYYLAENKSLTLTNNEISEDQRLENSIIDPVTMFYARSLSIKFTPAVSSYL